MKTALITGVTGQDGSYLAELLLSKGYTVHGTKRRSSSLNTTRIDHLVGRPDFQLHYADLTDLDSIRRVMLLAQPDEIYNLAAQSHVGLSFHMPIYTAQVTALGALNVLQAFSDTVPQARFYPASSSEMYGNEPAPQSERTTFAPRSPYACAKLMAHDMAITFRESQSLFVASGILFNHESPRRGETFVTRKITRGLARIAVGLEDTLTLGNLDARRDWGYAPEYVEAMWLMLQREHPDDYVIGTSVTATVGDFLEEVIRLSGVSRPRVFTGGSQYLRPSEVDFLCADTRRAATHLHWKAKTHWQALAGIMYEADLAAAQKEAKQLCAA